jgi:hypothetical protein
MYVNPMGIPIREITSVSVALKANVRSTTCAFLGSTLLADARMRSTVDDPMRKRVKVLARQMSKFRRLWELPVTIDNLVRFRPSAVGRYLGRLVPKSGAAS